MRCSPLTLLLVSASLAGCGTGRMVPAAGPEEGPVDAPAPGVEPTPRVAPTDRSDEGASGYAPYGGGQTALQIRRIGQWSASTIATPERLVIRDEQSWAAFWNRLGAFNRPAVDFTRDVVIAVASGQRSSGGYEIAIQRVTRTGNAVSIDVVETTPGPNCVTTQTLTQPIDVIVVAAADAGTWTFNDQTRVASCS
jgi:hypothetical protein